MQCIAWENGRLAVDVVQCYLYSRQSCNARVVAAEGEHGCVKERSPVITFVDGRIDLAIGPLIAGSGDCLNQNSNC